MRFRANRGALIAAVFFMLFAEGCSKAQVLDATARTLQTIQATTDVAWTYAVEQDLGEQEAVVAELRAIQTAGGQLPPRATVEMRLQAIRDRWESRFQAFRAIREAHALAVTTWEAVRDDRKPLEALVAALDEVLALYRAMQDLLGDVPAPDLQPEVTP